MLLPGGDGVPGAVPEHAARLPAAPDRVPVLGAVPQLHVVGRRLPRFGRESADRGVQPSAHAPYPSQIAEQPLPLIHVPIVYFLMDLFKVL